MRAKGLFHRNFRAKESKITAQNQVNFHCGRCAKLKKKRYINLWIVDNLCIVWRIKQRRFPGNKPS